MHTSGSVPFWSLISDMCRILNFFKLTFSFYVCFLVSYALVEDS